MQSVCPQCGARNLVQNLYCRSCNASMRGAELIPGDERAAQPPENKSPEPRQKPQSSDHSSQRSTVFLVAAVCFVAAIVCGGAFLLGRSGLVERMLGDLTPAPDANQQATTFANAVSTQVAVEKAAAAMLTAEAPTATNTPTGAPALPTTPTATTAPTITPTWTTTLAWTPSAPWTPSPSPTAVPSDTPNLPPTAKPTKKPAPKPTQTPTPALVITYQDFHYECEKVRWYSDLADEWIWGYRAFQTLMVIQNNSADRTVETPWQPNRWIVANWRNPQEERVLEGAWVWGSRDKGRYPKPSIPPGGTARWTFIAFPLDRWEYVKAAEFDRWDQTYRFEFPRPEYGGEYNMWDCGDYPDPQKPSWRNPADWTIPTP